MRIPNGFMLFFGGFSLETILLLSQWDGQGGVYDRSRGVRKNWILVWEDGFCNFAASAGEVKECGSEYQGLQPDLFFKMSHEIYNYGEGLIGKVAADHTHKWIHKEPNDQEINFLSAWHNSADSHPRTWEAQFRSGIKTIALIAVREGVIQLGAVHKVVEDLSYVVLLRKKLIYIESIPGVLLPHPSSLSLSGAAAYPSATKMDAPQEAWHYQNNLMNPLANEYYDHQMRIAPSMSSLEALLSKLPSVGPSSATARPVELMKEEEEEEGESSMPPGYYAFHHQDLNVNNSGC
ncbi:hypothetical protein SASPL_110601 [Salvia splendens]|uniref:Transcription factor MYC/MYB N-terminal domain-containing protein n=1 Tax=Salvia splendens TaxID=180675 RepID=A0A8X8YAT4_SALSN|nr:hypothetical protein SASPL_110601 [Salvia splendens]